MTARHPALDSAIPPTDATLAGRLMLDVALGLDDEDGILAAVQELVDDGDFAKLYPDDPEPTPDEARALLRRIITEHNALVTAPSPDRGALLAAVATLAENGVITSFSGATMSDAVGDAFELASELLDDGADVQGFVFSHREDLERLILHDRLTLGFGAMADGDDAAVEVGLLAANALRGAGLHVDWDGDPDNRIEVAPLRWAAPFERDETFGVVVEGDDIIEGEIVDEQDDERDPAAGTDPAGDADAATGTDTAAEADSATDTDTDR